ncbi:MAG: formyltetrahydrofolate deformylase [SAR324 cluster bacterium]|nr:formyltetrahydrofolate deformylase [SAR324 cluster bacterium]
MTANKAILMIHCSDQQGLIAKITSFIFGFQGNITYLDQYVDPDEDRFFMRLEWELDSFNVTLQEFEAKFLTELATPLKMQYQLSYTGKSQRVAIFVTKESHCLFDILARVKAEEFNIEVPAIISNREDLRFVADLFGIPFYHFEITKENHKAQENAELELLQSLKIDLVVLARYMRIVTAVLVDPFENKIINIHHSMLPAFAGARPYHAAIERGVKVIGATSHYVTCDLDQGPIIEQETAHVKYNEKLPELLRKGKDLEKIVLSRAIALHLERRVMVYKNRTVIFKT